MKRCGITIRDVVRKIVLKVILSSSEVYRPAILNTQSIHCEPFYLDIILETRLSSFKLQFMLYTRFLYIHAIGQEEISVSLAPLANAVTK